MDTEIKLIESLKGLRKSKNISPQNLAIESGVNPSLIYKAESQPGNVKINSIRKAYYSLCETEQEWANLLLLWAVVADENQTPLAAIEEVATRIKQRATVEVEPLIQAVVDSAKNVATADLLLLTEGINEFAKNKFARSMVKNWLEAQKTLSYPTN